MTQTKLTYSTHISNLCSLKMMATSLISPPRLPSAYPPIELNDIHISLAVLQRAMDKLKTNSAAGPDLLPPIFYRNTQHSLKYPLTTLFRNCIDLHQLPNEWKFAIITPKFKSGSPSLPSNYRPIALTTCTCCKILETHHCRSTH